MKRKAIVFVEDGERVPVPWKDWIGCAGVFMLAPEHNRRVQMCYRRIEEEREVEEKVRAYLEAKERGEA